jgi:hypothetical protein
VAPGAPPCPAPRLDDGPLGHGASVADLGIAIMCAMSDDELLRMAHDLLAGEASEPVFISLDGRTLEPSRVRRAVRALVEERLRDAPEVDLHLSDITERLLEWGSLVVSEDVARALVQDLAREGWVEVLVSGARAVRVRAGAGPSP